MTRNRKIKTDIECALFTDADTTQLSFYQRDYNGQTCFYRLREGGCDELNWSAVAASKQQTTTTNERTNKRAWVKFAFVRSHVFKLIFWPHVVLTQLLLATACVCVCVCVCVRYASTTDLVCDVQLNSTRYIKLRSLQYRQAPPPHSLTTTLIHLNILSSTFFIISLLFVSLSDVRARMRIPRVKAAPVRDLRWKSLLCCSYSPFFFFFFFWLKFLLDCVSSF